MREGPLWTDTFDCDPSKIAKCKNPEEWKDIYTWTESAEERAAKWKPRRRIRFFTMVAVSECALSAFSYLLFILISSRWEQLTL